MNIGDTTPPSSPELIDAEKTDMEKEAAKEKKKIKETLSRMTDSRKGKVPSRHLPQLDKGKEERFGSLKRKYRN